MEEKQRWRAALTGSLLIHVLLIVAVGAFWSWDSIRSQQPVYVEVTIAELFSPLSDAGGGSSGPAMPSSSASSHSSSASGPSEESPRLTDLRHSAPAQGTSPAIGAGRGNGGSGGSGGGGAGGGVGTGTGTGTGSGNGPGTGSGPTRGPRVVEGSRPEYPDIARARGWEGTVRLQLLINTDGRVDEVRLIGSSGHAELDRAAQQAILAWRFSPALQKGVPVAAWATVPVVFDLQ